MSANSFIRIAALSSPAVWFASHAAQFALAPLTCLWHSNTILWIASACALLLVAGSGFAALSAWRSEPRCAPMPRWLALSGIALSGGFFLVIAAQTIPSLMLGGCE